VHDRDDGGGMTDDIPEHAPGGVLRSVDTGDFDEETFLAVLRETVDALEEHDIPHLLMGGLAVAAIGRPRWTHDIDVFLRPDDAKRALGVLADVGYTPEERDPLWLFKAVKEGVLVDLIFRSTGHLYLEDEMLARAVETTFKGERIRVLPPEDLIVIKAAAQSEDSGYHWFDALAVLSGNTLDWSYLVSRARRAVRRVLSFLVFAESSDAAVPGWVIKELVGEVYGDRPPAVGPDTEAERGGANPVEVQELRDRLRADPRTADFDIGVEVYGNTLLLTGEVATDERRSLLGEVARELVPDREVDNRTRVRRLSETIGVEEVS
jgi:predicted nucleotidyltransferase